MYYLVLPDCGDVGDMIDVQSMKRRQAERKYLIDIIKCLRYLARQGIPLQGHDDNDNLTQALLLLGAKDDNIIKHLQGQIGHKYTHHNMQNELLDIMASQVLREKLSAIRERKIFSLIADEGTDISNIEQLSLCIRSVDDNFEVSEDFVGFYELSNIKSETIVNSIKDILIRCHLSLDNCRGQTYDGASNMMGKRSGVSAKICREQPKAKTIHCQGHSLSLAVKSLTQGCAILRDTLGTVAEICVLVKYSPKREKILGNIMENIEGDFGDGTRIDHRSKLDKLCVTRWTVRAKCYKKILDNYEALLQLWNEALEENLDIDTKSRIGGCKKQMEMFAFYFGLSLSQRFYAITDNLSKTLQKEKMSALQGKELADLTVETLENMRNESDFKLLYEKITMYAKKISAILEPAVPRKRKRPHYSILQYVEGGTQSSQEAYYRDNAYDYFKPIYYEALDSIIHVIKERFNQPAFEMYAETEQLLLKAAKKQDITDDLKVLQRNFEGDYDANSIEAELPLLPAIFQCHPINFEDIVQTFQSISREKRLLMKNIACIIKIILTNGATSATPERSFSMLRRIKTWMRSRMSQKRLNSLSIIYCHKSILDELPLVDVANEFVGVQPDRQNSFGRFTEKDI